jgi:hypothetical protein
MEIDPTWNSLIIRAAMILVGLIIAGLVIWSRRRRHSPLARLVVEDSAIPGLVGAQYFIKDYPVTIGLARENDIHLARADETVSRFHARLECIEGQVCLKEVLIRDVEGVIRGPRNGTWVDGQPVSAEGAPVEIHPGSTIRLGGRFLLRFEEILLPPSRLKGTVADIQIPHDALPPKKNS